MSKVYRGNSVTAGAMVSELQHGFRLGPWQIMPLMGEVSGHGETRHLEPKVMEVLMLLAANANRLTPREQLMQGVWSEHVAADQLLTRAISELRRALDDHGEHPRLIETVPKRGYRLTGNVEPLEATAIVEPLTAGRRFHRTGYALAAVFVIAAIFGLVLANRNVPDEQAARAPAGITPGNFTRFGTFAPSVTSMAVLPFINLSDNAANQYFSDGLTEEIRNLLARTPTLKVIGRTSSSVFKDRHEDVRLIGQLLGAKLLLEGSVRRSGDRIRVGAQLINAGDGSHVWADTYDREMTDIFELQDDLAAAIIDAMKMHIGVYPSRGRPTDEPEAYALYLKAKVALNIQDAPTAEAALRQAVTLDPEFAEAHELLAHVYWTDGLPEVSDAQIQPLIRQSSSRALAIDPDLDLARALLYEGDPENYTWAEVLEAGIRAANAQPNNPETMRTLSWNLLITGYLEEALRVSERLVEIDPLSSIAHVRNAAALGAVGRAAESSAAIRAARPLGGTEEIDWYIGEAHFFRNEDDQALKYFQSAVRGMLGGDEAWVKELMEVARSQPEVLDQHIAGILATMSPEQRETWHHHLHRFHLFVGNNDRYFEILLDHRPSYAKWSEAIYYLWEGVIYGGRGFTAHPKYLEVAELMGFTDVWEQRGPPDFCRKIGRTWACD